MGLFFLVFAVLEFIWMKVSYHTQGIHQPLIADFFGFFSPASHARRACEARALRARKTLTPRFTDFFTDFEKETDCFAVYIYQLSFMVPFKEKLF